MNPQQMAQQIKHELQQVAWPDGSAADVFGSSTESVVVFAGFATEEQMPNVLPCALVRIDSGDADPDHPELLTQRFTVIVATDVPGDPMGEFALLGGPTSDVGLSAMRGVAEIDERVRSAVQSLHGVDGAPIMVSSSSLGAPTPLGDGRHLVTSELTLECLCTSALNYQEPQELASDGSTWTWEGTHCSSRYDFIQFRLCYSAGSTPPASPGDADVIVGATTNETLSHTNVSGQAYAIFADYGRRGGSTIVASSDPLVGSYLTT